jgi:tetratricopeptide (TPR) repeat protein
MKYFISWSVLLCSLLSAQPRTTIHILDCHVEAELDGQRAEVSGTLSAWLRVTADSVSEITFTVPSNIDINSIRDIDDDRFSRKRSLNDNNKYTHTIALPAWRFAGDSIFVKIAFEGVSDTSSYKRQFINPQEFLLLQSPEISWLPYFGNSTADRVSLSLTAEKRYHIIGGYLSDSSFTNGKRCTWYFTRTKPTRLSEFYSLCGSATAFERTQWSADSFSTISLFADTSRFNTRFADSLLSYLIDAVAYFKTITGFDSLLFRHTFVCLGQGNVELNDEHLGMLTIKRNSPVNAVFDSSLFNRSVFNSWLNEVARTFSLSTDDSTAVFDDGWAGYLASRYLFSKYSSPDNEVRERRDLLVRILSFYPTRPLASGRSPRRFDSEIMSLKGRYVFLMLEHLVGRASFDSVVKKMYRRFLNEKITLAEFQKLCEEEYGSPLDWFFQEWFYRSSIPEFVLQWHIERTQRGTTTAKVIIEQRSDVFTMPLTLFFTIGTKKIPKRIMVNQTRQEFLITLSAVPTAVELDPQKIILRWLLDLRILAHARSAELFRAYDKDTASSKREAQLTLELDPLNATGSAPIAYCALGKLAVIQHDVETAKEYFLKAMQAAPGEEAILYPLLSLVRYANIVEMEGNRNDALPMYQRALEEGRKNPMIFAPVIIESEKYLNEPFAPSTEFWYGLY